jgi:cell division protein FtsL
MVMILTDWGWGLTSQLPIPNPHKIVDNSIVLINKLKTKSFAFINNSSIDVISFVHQTEQLTQQNKTNSKYKKSNIPH